MSYLIPYWLLDINQQRKYREAAQDEAMKKAMYINLAANRHELEINELAPAHLGLESWYTPPCRAGEFTSWIDQSFNLDKVVVIYKVTQLEFRPKIDRLKIEESFYSWVYELSQLYIYGHEGYFTEPHVLSGRVKISVGTGRTVKAGQKFLLNGFVIERSRHD